MSDTVITTAPAPTIVRLAFSALCHENTTLNIDIRDTLLASSLIHPFESMVLRSCTAKFTLAPTSDVGAHYVCAFIPKNLATTRAAATSAVDQYQSFASTTSPVNGVLALPSDHFFGRELKATTLGNQPPKFVIVPDGFKIRSATPSGSGSSATVSDPHIVVAIATVIIDVEVRGRSV